MDSGDWLVWIFGGFAILLWLFLLLLAIIAIVSGEMSDG